MSLIEMLVAMTLLIVIMGIMFGATREIGRAWTNTSGKIESFRNARTAFDAMLRTLRQATLNGSYDYVDRDGNFRGSGMSGGNVKTFVPYAYARQSDLHFICGQGKTLLSGMAAYTPVTHAVFFQAPIGKTASSDYVQMDQLLNACGFYVVYGPDPNIPNFLGISQAVSRKRYRLMQFTQPADRCVVYKTSTAAGNASTWFTASTVDSFDSSSNFVLGENVIALVIWPKRAAGDQDSSASLTADYSYNSREAGTFSSSGFPPTFNQLPSVIGITMVVIDEASAVKFGNPDAAPNARLGLTPGLFTHATYPGVDSPEKNQLELDLETLGASLVAAHVNYRVFQTEVSLREAKWSEN